MPAQQDPVAAVRHLIDESVAILVRTMPVYEVVRRASADPDVSALLEQTRSRRRADQRPPGRIQALRISAKADYAVRASLRDIVEHVTVADVAEGRLPERITRLTSEPDSWAAR